MAPKEHVLVQALPWRSKSASPEVLEEVLATLEAGLPKADFKACRIASRRLATYLELKGPMSLEQRANAIELLLQWALLPEALVHEQLRVLRTLKPLLLKRRPGMNVRVDWCALWNVVDKVHLRRDDADEASSQVLASHAIELVAVCHAARKFYGEEAIDQVCELANSYMEDPLSRDLFTGQMILALFLPSVRSDKYGPHLERWVTRDWGLVQESDEWDIAWLTLARRAIKWGGSGNLSYATVAQLFRCVQNGLLLPSPSGANLAPKCKRPAHLRRFCPAGPAQVCAAKLAVLLLGCGSAAEYYAVREPGAVQLTANSQDELAQCLEADSGLSAGLLHVRQILGATRTLFHPSNSSRHSGSVVQFMEVTCAGLAKRLGRERVPGVFGEWPTLQHQDKAALVDTVLPLVAMALYSKSRSVSHAAERSLAHLAFLAPVRVSKHFLPLIGDALDPYNLNQTHQAPAAIKMLTVLVQPLLQVRPLLAESLPELLELTLPGLDSNDVTKTITTCMFFQVVLSWVPIIQVDDLDFPADVSFPSHKLSFTRSYGVDDPAEEAAQDEAPMRDAMWRGAPVLVEWGLACLDRILAFVDNLLQRSKGGVAAQWDEVVASSLSLTARLLLSQMCPRVLRRAGKRINEWALSSCNLDALRESKSIVRSFASSVLNTGDEELVREVLLQGLLEPVLALALDPDTSQRKREWALLLLGAMLRVAGSAALPYEKDLQRAIDRALKDEEANIRKLGGKLLRRTMRGLSEYYIRSRASTPGLSGGSPEALAVAAVSWAQPEAWTTTCAEVDWHVPSAEELAMASRLKDAYLKRSLDALRAGREEGEKAAFFRRHLEVLFQVCRGMARITDARVEREELQGQVGDLLTWMLAERDSDTVSHRRAVKVLRTLLSCYGANTASHDKLAGRKLWFRYMRNMTTSLAYSTELLAACKEDLVPDRQDWVVPRFHQLDDINTLLQWQLHQVAFERAREAKDADDEGALAELFRVLQNATTHQWEGSRKSAVEGLKAVMGHAPWFGKAHVEDLIAQLVPADEDAHGAVLGAAKVLGWMKCQRWITTDWRLLDKMFRVAVFEAEKVKVLADDKQQEAGDALQKLVVSVLGFWNRLPTGGARDEKLRAGLFKDLTDSSRTAGLGWRQQIVACVILAALAEEQDPALSPDVLEWVLERAHRSEMLPLRIAACSVLVQLLVKAPAAARSSTVEAIASGSGEDCFARVLSETLAQSHSNASVSVDGNAKGIKQRSEWSTGVGDLLRLARFPGSKFAPRSCAPQQSTAFVVSHKLLLEALVRVLPAGTGADMFEPQLEYLLFENVHTAEHQSRVCTAAEIFSGLVAVEAREDLLGLADKFLTDASLELAGVWLDAYRYSDNAKAQSAGLDAAVAKLPKVLADRSDMSKSTLAANCLRLVRVLVHELPQSELERVRGPLVSTCLDHLDHTFESVRRELGRTLAALMDVSARRGEEDGRWAEDAVSEAVSQARAAPREKEVSAGSRTIETTTHVAASLVLNGGPARDRLLVHMAALAIESQGHPNMEVSRLARLTCNYLASTLAASPHAAVELLVAVAEAIAQAEDNWHGRMVGGVTLGMMLAVNLNLAGFAVSAVHMRKEVEKLLRDPQPEVQNSASAVLTHVLSALPSGSPSLEVTKTRYIKLAKTKMARGQAKTDEGKEKLKKRATGVLGLTALVHAFPYTVPFPDAVVAVARRVGDPSPVGQSAKQAILKFKHTHMDSWEEAKRHFTTEELEDLQDSSYSGAHS